MPKLNPLWSLIPLALIIAGFVTTAVVSSSNAEEDPLDAEAEQHVVTWLTEGGELPDFQSDEDMADRESTLLMAYLIGKGEALLNDGTFQHDPQRPGVVWCGGEAWGDMSVMDKRLVVAAVRMYSEVQSGASFEGIIVNDMQSDQQLAQWFGRDISRMQIRR